MAHHSNLSTSSFYINLRFYLYFDFISIIQTELIYFIFISSNINMGWAVEVESRKHIFSVCICTHNIIWSEFYLVFKGNEEFYFYSFRDFNNNFVCFFHMEINIILNDQDTVVVLNLNFVFLFCFVLSMVTKLCDFNICVVNETSDINA